MIKPVFGYEDKYLINDVGEVFNSRGWKLKDFSNENGYRRISLSKDGKSRTFQVHRLVLLSFGVLPENPFMEVNHKDQIRDNNSLTNLEWVTSSENKSYSKSYEVALISPDQELYTFKNVREFCRHHNLNQSGIHKVITKVYKQHNGWRLYAAFD